MKKNVCLNAALWVLGVFLCTSLAQAAEQGGKFIRYGKTTVNASQHGVITLQNPIAEADEAKVAAMIKDAGGQIPLVIGIKFEQPQAMFYTLNARVSDPKQAVTASKKAKDMYQSIQKFLKSNEGYLDLGE